MLDSLRSRLHRSEASADEPAPPAELAPLRMLAAPLLLLSGVEVTLEALARARSSPAGEEAGGGTARAAVWAPSLIAPVAAAAQLAHLTRPSEAVSAAGRVLNTAVAGVGLGATAEMLLAYRERRGPPSLAPLALAAAGVLGLLLDRQEREIAAERRRLERRASLVERWTPRRRTRVDRVVVHV